MADIHFKRSDLVDRLHQRFREHKNYFEITDAVNYILEDLTDALAIGDRLEVRGFGTLYTRSLPSRTGRNPKTGESVHVPERRRVLFKCSKSVLNRLNKE